MAHGNVYSEWSNVSTHVTCQHGLSLLWSPDFLMYLLTVGEGVVGGT